MAGLVVQSRFAGLLVEGEDYCSDEQKKKIKNNTAKKAEPPKKAKPVPVKTQVPKKKKPKQAAQTSNQWEQWKQKDEQLVDGNFEEELQQAILLSKLDYEEKKDVYQQIKKEAENTKKKEEAARTSIKKQKKKNVMSLDQFNDMVTAGDEPKTSQEEETPTEPKSEKPKDDTEFFERVKSETKSELLKDKIIDRVKSQTRHQTPDITKAQFVDALEKKDKEIHALKEEVTNLKKELLTVKSRNKKLCSILGQGEMKDKAEVLIEVERLRAVQAELTGELGALHGALERERSRHGDPRAKDKKNSTKKKNIRFDVSSEALISKESSSGTA